LHEQFEGVRPLLDRLGVRIIDLLDVFETVDDLNRYRVGERNMHPNEQGHQFLYERLHEALAADPELLEIFTGRQASATASDQPSSSAH
jgi:hypothetical protein